MSVVVPSRDREDAAAIVIEPPAVYIPQLPAATVEPPSVPVTAARSDTHRWLLILGVPFVVGAAFFADAIGFDVEWPMAPAFLLGPLLMIAGYIYLSLSADTNTG